MRRVYVTGSSIALILTAFATALGYGAHQESAMTEPGSPPLSLALSQVSVWEAYAKGNATVQQVDVTFDLYGQTFTEPLGYRVKNLGSAAILIDEKAMLMSPHPLETNPDPAWTTQDGVLTDWTVPANGQVTFHYATFVVDPPVLPDPKWWCMERHEVVQGDVYVRLGGEILPFVMENMINNYGTTTQDDLWIYMTQHPTLVVGKTPLWKSLPDLAGTTVDITIAVTNMAIYDSSMDDGSAVKAVDSLVVDTIPPGYSYDPNSFNVQPFSIVSNPDGSKTLTWKVTIPGADVNGHNDETYTPYNHILLKYKLILPEFTAGRHLLPRATVDTGHDGTVDVHSAKPLLEIYHVNRPPVANAGGPYTIYEGDTVTFNAGSSYDPDSWPSNLSYRWDFENDGVWDTPWMTQPTYSRRYGDDLTATVVVQVSDGGLTATASSSLVVRNVLPSGTLSVSSSQQHEGTAIVFSAHVTDPGSDDLLFTWSWGDGTPDGYSTYYNNGVSPDPYPSPDVNPHDVTDSKSHTYGDNGAFTVKVVVRDDDSGSSGTTIQITATPGNLPPSVAVSGGSSIDEGQSVTLTATATDPGSDDLTFAWSWGDGTPDGYSTYYNNGVSPDPPQSPGGTYPFTATDVATHPYGDNGLYTVTLTVTDDDGGSTMWAEQVTVLNLPPTLTTFGPFSLNEAEPLSVTSSAVDAGSDDLTFTWIFELGPTIQNVYYNDGVGPDPYPSPGGIYPFTATDNAAHTYGDNGVFTISLTVTDDDGGSATWSTIATFTNLPPAITAFGPFDVYEATPLTATSTAADPGSDDLIFTWAFEYGPTLTNVFFNDGAAPDPPKSPDGVWPFTATDTAAHTYGDDGTFRILLTVEDDDGGVATYETTVTVHNVPPTILDARAFAVADFTLRIAGEKWHDVILRIYEDGTEVGYAQVIRYPGSPNDQMATIHDVKVSLNRDFSVVAYYTPDDDPINGQPNGADPFWLILGWEDGNETWLHHTFNVMHPETWVWAVDNVYIYALGRDVHLEGIASDPGSDDLVFLWDSGDGRTFTTVSYNNGLGPDPYPSPDVSPITAVSEVVLVYAVAGTYAVTLTVTDDDGGSATTSITIKIG